MGVPPPITNAETKALFPYLDLKAQFASIREEVLEAITRVMESQHFILGKEVENFENEIAAYCETPNAVSCASGSDALLLALLAADIGAGDEIITTPFTFVATAGAIARTGAMPVFVDINLETFNLDPRLLEAAITPRSRAIIAVHLFGLASDMDELLKIAQMHNLVVIEDAAQAIGARYKGVQAGNLGTCGCFSFFPSNNLGGAGDGGLVSSNDAEFADRVKLLRVHGSRKKYFCEIVGTNSRLDALQAAILRVKLRYLSEWTHARRDRAATYIELLREQGLSDRVMAPTVPADSVHVFNQFTIRATRRDELKAFLKNEGIPTEVYYPTPLHLQPAFQNLGYESGSLPNSEAASREALSLPNYPELKRDDQANVVGAITEFYRKH